jgi:cell division protein FtsB
MFIEKLKYKISAITEWIRSKEINFKAQLLNLFYLLVILFLGSQIVITFNNGFEDLKRFQAEEARLSQLKQENEELKRAVEQYSSIEYKKIYARENLNLAEKQETLYYVERENTVLEIEKLPEDTMQISLEDNVYWWKKLILGL